MLLVYVEELASGEARPRRRRGIIKCRVIS